MTKIIFSIILGSILVMPVSAQTPLRLGPEDREGTKRDIREEIQIKRDALKEEIEKKRTEFKESFEAARTQLQTQIEVKKEELKSRLLKIKDERKRDAVERITGRINDLNSRRLDHFTQVLDKLSRVLSRIAERMEKVASRGIDVTKVKEAIAKAEQAIASAREAIKAQTGKAYTAAVSTEANLRADVGKTRQALHNDLAKVWELVKAAHQAVREAAVALAQLPKPEAGTSTAPIQ